MASGRYPDNSPGGSSNPLPSGRVTLASAASSITISGLNGDTDGDYELVGSLILPAATVNNLLVLKPNGDAGNATSLALIGVSGSSTGNQAVTLIVGIPNTSGLQVIIDFIIRFTSKSGDGPHLYTSQSSYLDAVSRTNWSCTGQYTSTSTPITSLVISSNQAGSMASGSFVRWRALGFTA